MKLNQKLKSLKDFELSVDLEFFLDDINESV